MKPCRSSLALVLAAWLAFPAHLAGAQQSGPALLQIRILDGDGAVHTAGTRSSQPLVIFVSDESGRAVPAAAVSIRLPEEGPSGVFLTGLRTEVLLTADDGRVTVHGIQWNRLPGPAQIRITASKGDARAGIVSTQSLTAPAGATPRRESPSAPPPVAAPSSRSKWLLLAALIGGAAAGGVAAAARGPRSSPSAAPSPPAAASVPTVGIGSPSITIGKP
jgi:hypothetical protein